MRHPPNHRTYITDEAATLIGITFAAATSYIVSSIMARRKKTGAPKAPLSTSPTPADAATAVVAAPVMPEADTRPETS